MPVRDLAPALLAVGDLFAVASGTLYPQFEPVAVEVQATEPGSFVVKLYLDAHAAWDQFVDIFSGDESSALANLLENVFGSVGLVALIKRIGSRRVVRADHPPQPGMIRLTLDDQTTLEIPTDAWTLYRTVEVRKHTREIIKPLEREGVKEVRFTATEPAEEVVVEKDDLPAFERIEEAEEPLLEAEQEMFLEIVSVAFRRDNKWRFSVGGGEAFWASIEDEVFAERVERGEEAFRKGDLLRCLVEINQTRDAEGLHTTYRVLEVRAHLPRAIQLTFGGNHEQTAP
jgi:hypothetical protein